MDLLLFLIALSFFFLIVYVIEKITKKTDAQQSDVVKYQCPHCNSIIHYQQHACGVCKKDLEW